MNFLKGFMVWILMSTIFVSCYSKSVPVKRRMVLRLPFVHNQDSGQNSFQQRNFLRMLNGNSKIKKAADLFQSSSSDDSSGSADTQPIYIFSRIY